MRTTRQSLAILATTAIAAAGILLPTSQAKANEGAPVQFAVSNAPNTTVRTTLYTNTDRDTVTVDEVRWRGRGWYGYRPYYRPYYAPRVYSNYYYSRPYTSFYYGPGYGYSYYYGPRVTYRPWYGW